MTIHDPERQWAKPVEEVAKAIWQARELRWDPGLRRMTPDAMDMKTGTFALVVADAETAIAKLTELGFLNDQFFTALKAEQEAGKK